MLNNLLINLSYIHQMNGFNLSPNISHQYKICSDNKHQKTVNYLMITNIHMAVTTVEYIEVRSYKSSETAYLARHAYNALGYVLTNKLHPFLITAKT